MTNVAADIDGYLQTIPDEERAALAAVRRTVHEVAPEAIEAISYAMPAFKYRGRPLVYFCAWQKHCALYGLPLDAHHEALAAFETEKGTLRFTPKAPVPEALLRALLRERIAAIDAAEEERRRRRAKPHRA